MEDNRQFGNCDFEHGIEGVLSADEQLSIAMDYFHKLHRVRVSPANNVKVFDNIREEKKLIEIALNVKENLSREFEEIIRKIDRLYEAVLMDAERLGLA